MGDLTKEFTDDNFETEVIKSAKPVLVDFWAEWCGPCRQIAPAVDEIAAEYKGRAIVGKVNVDENSDSPQTYGIRSIPALLIFKNGEVVDKLVGAVPKSQLKEKLEAYV